MKQFSDVCTSLGRSRFLTLGTIGPEVIQPPICPNFPQTVAQFRNSDKGSETIRQL
jgi:hypothetical protein